MTTTASGEPKRLLTRGLVLIVLALGIIAVSPTAAQQREVPDATDEHGGFGLPDAAGTRLLVLPELTRPDALVSALCSGGGRAAVRFARRQPEDTNNGRQTAHNFDKLAGNLYDVTGASIPTASASSPAPRC